MMFTTRNIYIGAMALGGLVLAIASTRWPVVNDGPVPPLMSLLMISLVFDLVIAGAVGLAAGWLVRRRVVARLGGITGDTLGAVCEITFTATLVAAALLA